MDPATIGAVIGGIGSIFGKKKDKIYKNDAAIMDSARGARQASAEFGFNPLTLLGATGGAGAVASGGSSPLASLSIIGDVMQANDPQKKADEERQRKREELDLELAQIKLDQARSGVIIGPQQAASSIGGRPALGNSTTRIATAGAVRTSQFPMARPSFEGAGTIPVFNLSGGEMQINRRVADRLRLKPWDVYIGEDAEAHGGELAGQAVMLPQIPAIPGNMGGIGNPFTERGDSKEKRKQDYQWFWSPKFNLFSK